MNLLLQKGSSPSERREPKNLNLAEYNLTNHHLRKGTRYSKNRKKNHSPTCRKLLIFPSHFSLKVIFPYRHFHIYVIYLENEFLTRIRRLYSGHFKINPGRSFVCLFNMVMGNFHKGKMLMKY